MSPRRPAAPPPPDPPSPRRSSRLAILSEIARIATEDLELRPMLQRITDALAARLGWEFVALVRIEDDPPRFVCEALTTNLPTAVHVGYGRDLGSGVVGRVAASGEPLLLDDPESFPGFVDTLDGARSELCVPVRHRGRVVAVLNAESRRRAAFRGQLRLAMEIADQVSGAVASARLYEEVKRRASLLEVLSELSRTALAAGDLEGGGLDAVLQRIVDYVQQRFDLELVAIVVTDDDRTEWRHRAFAPRAVGEGIKRKRWPVAEGVVGRAIRTGAPQLVLDVAADPDYFRGSDRVVAEYAVPIVLGGDLLGVLNFEAASPAAFSSDHLAVFRMAADQVAGAIQLALVNRRLEDSRAEVERTNRWLQEANRALERQTRSDGLTGVANRRAFDRTLEIEWRRGVRRRDSLALILADLDHFKAFNDAHGHLRGDECLKRVAKILASGAQRAGDLVARYGGEEFALLLPGLATDEAVALADTLRRRIEALGLAWGEAPGERVTLSAGVAAGVPAAGEEAASLVAAADGALYEAKQRGRNRVCRAPAGGGPPAAGAARRRAGAARRRAG
jgi:diguanylate cyclase (GGDEF)-like protein